MPITFGPSGATLDLLDKATHAIREGGVSIQQAHERTIVPLANRNASRITSSRMTETVIELRLKLAGTSADNLATNYRNLVDRCSRARRYWLEGVGTVVQLTYQWTGATNSVVYDVLDAEVVPPVTQSILSQNRIEEVTLRLICQPLAHAATANAPTQVATNNQTAWTPAAVSGDAPVPARIRVQNAAGNAGTTMADVRIAARSRGTPANFLYPHKLGPATSPATNPTVAYNLGSRIQSLTFDLIAGHRVAAANPIIWKMRYSTGSTVAYDLPGTVPFLIATASGWAHYTVQSVINPITHAPWQVSDLQAGARFGLRTTSGTTADGTTAGRGRAARLACIVNWLDRDLLSTNTTLLPVAQGPEVGNWGALYIAGATAGGAVSTNNWTVLDDVASTTNATANDDAIEPTFATGQQFLVQFAALAALNSSDSALSIPVSPLLLNGGMEQPYIATGAAPSVTATGTVAAAHDWTIVGAPGALLSTDSTQIQVGAAAQGISSTGATGANHVIQTAPVTSGAAYRFRGTIYISATGPVGNIELRSGTATAALSASATGFSAVESTITPGTTSLDVVLYKSTGAGQVIFDALRLTRDDTGTYAAQVNLATNMADQFGNFRAFARVKPPAETFPLRLAYGGASGDAIDSSAVLIASSTNVQLVDLGPLSIPEQDTPASNVGQFLYTIRVPDWSTMDSSAFATDQYLHVDSIELLPIDEFYFEATGMGGLTTGRYVVADAQARTPVVYLANSSGQRIRTVQHAGYLPVFSTGTNRIFVRLSRSGTDDRLTDQYAADLNYYEQYEFAR